MTDISNDPGAAAQEPAVDSEPPVLEPTGEPNPLLARVCAMERALAALGDAVGAGGNSSMSAFTEWRKTIS